MVKGNCRLTIRKLQTRNKIYTKKITEGDGIWIISTDSKTLQIKIIGMLMEIKNHCYCENYYFIIDVYWFLMYSLID